MTLKLITPPTDEPVTATEVKLQCRISSADEDALLATYIKAARERAEALTGLVFVSQTWELALDAFPDGEILLPAPPVSAINSISYYDADGVLQVMAAADYVLDNYGTQRHWAIPAPAVEWPSTIDAANAVRVSFTAGYGAASDVPAGIRSWILAAVGSMYAQRETIQIGNGDIKGVEFLDGLLDPFKVIGV